MVVESSACRGGLGRLVSSWYPPAGSFSADNSSIATILSSELLASVDSLLHGAPSRDRILAGLAVNSILVVRDLPWSLSHEFVGEYPNFAPSFWFCFSGGSFLVSFLVLSSSFGGREATIFNPFWSCGCPSWDNLG